MRKLGVVNGFVPMRGKVDGKPFEFNGTTLDLIRQAIANGGVAGSRIDSELGAHVLTPNEHESRIPEKLWADKVMESK
jgi:hypothetical protein